MAFNRPRVLLLFLAVTVGSFWVGALPSSCAAAAFGFQRHALSRRLRCHRAGSPPPSTLPIGDRLVLRAAEEPLKPVEDDNDVRPMGKKVRVPLQRQPVVTPSLMLPSILLALIIALVGLPNPSLADTIRLGDKIDIMTDMLVSNVEKQRISVVWLPIVWSIVTALFSVYQNQKDCADIKRYRKGENLRSSDVRNIELFVECFVLLSILLPLIHYFLN